MSNEVVFAPVSSAQSQFLLSDAWLTLYGGAAFAGKSFCLLGSMLPIISDPGTRACVIRKTTKQLSGSGSLFDAAIHLYSQVDPKLRIKSRDLTLVFSSGAEIQFTYLDKPADRMNLQGKEFSRINFDEAQQLTSDNVFYALSRLRSTRVSYPKQAFATCNPDPDTYLFDFVKDTLDHQMIPIRKDTYEKRYFYRSQTELLWYNNKDEAERIHGTDEESGVKSFLYVPGTILDNPVGLEQNKEYISTLKALPEIESRRLLNGAWVRESKSGYFKREWVGLVPHHNLAAKKRVRAWDLAFSEPSQARPDVDATAGVLMSKGVDSLYTVEDVITLRKRVLDVEQAIFQTAQDDGKDVTISLPLDPGATAGAYCKDLARRLGEKGFHVRLVRPEKGKLQRFLPFASVAEAGFIKVVNGDWTEAFFQELEKMDFTNNTHDDRADACSDAFFNLNKILQLPSFTLPTLTTTASFGFQPSQLPTDLSTPLQQGEFSS